MEIFNLKFSSDIFFYELHVKFKCSSVCYYSRKVHYYVICRDKAYNNKRQSKNQQKYIQKHCTSKLGLT